MAFQTVTSTHRLLVVIATNTAVVEKRLLRHLEAITLKAIQFLDPINQNI